MRILINFLFSFVLLCALSGCSQVPAIEEAPSTEFAVEGLHPVSASGFTATYALPGANLPAYRKVHIEALELGNIATGTTTVNATLRRDWQMTPEREAALQQVWAQSMDSAFRGYERASSGDTTLRITAEITRVAPGRPTANTVGGGFQAMGSSQDVVEIFMEFRCYNQDSGQLLAVIRDSRTMISQSMSRTAPVAVQTMFNSWAALLHTRVSGR